MRLIVFGLVALFAFVAPRPAMAQAQPPLPVEAFGALPAVSDVAISPNGALLALVRTNSVGEPLIEVINVDERRRVFAAAPSAGNKVRSVAWIDNRYLQLEVSQALSGSSIAFRSAVRFRGSPDQLEYFRALVIDLSDQSMRVVSTLEDFDPRDFGGRAVGPIAGDDGFIRFVGLAPPQPERRNATSNYAVVGPIWMRLTRINLATGDRREIRVNGVDTDTIRLHLDYNGAVVAREDIEDDTNIWNLFVYDGREERLLQSKDNSGAGPPISVVGLFPDGRLAALADNGDEQFSRLIALDRATGAPSVVFEREGFDVRAAIRDPWTREVVGAAWTETEAQQVFFDDTLTAAATAARAANPDAIIELLSWSADRRRFVIYAEYGMDGGSYSLFTPATGETTLIAQRYPTVAAALSRVGQRQSITYRARDGVRVPAYLTLPANREARGLPLVVLVHGGPHGARDTMDFDWWAAFLSSRGYAVLQPNFRGSGGYGAAWQEAGFGQWGQLMQRDVDDGVAGLVRSGIVDAARVCIMGASYGGYAAMAGATLTPDLYRCAVSVNGVSDLDRFLRDRLERYGAESAPADWWQMSIGDREEDRAALRAVSPYYNAAAARIPILLIASSDDSVVSMDHSTRMRDALQAAGRDVSFVTLSGEDHWLSFGPTRTQMLREVETFLSQHLPAQ